MENFVGDKFYYLQVVAESNCAHGLGRIC